MAEQEFEARAWGLVIRVSGVHIHLSGGIAPMDSGQARAIADDLIEAADKADANRRKANDRS